MNDDVSFEHHSPQSPVPELHLLNSQHMAGLFPIMKSCLRKRVANHLSAWRIICCRVITTYRPYGCGLFETSRPCQKSVDSIAMGERFSVCTSEPLKPRFLSHFGYADIGYTSRLANTAIGAE